MLTIWMKRQLKGSISNIPCTAVNVSKDQQDDLAKMTSTDEKELYRLMNKSDVMAEARELHEVFPEIDLPADNVKKQNGFKHYAVSGNCTLRHAPMSWKN
jgi:hypothetical protein